MRIALIADSHVSLRSPECVQNWNAVAKALPALDVALTLHLGDVTLDGQRHPEEIEYAAGLIRNWPTPIYCVPGNHDMGTGCGEEPLSVDKLLRYQRALGVDRWFLRYGEWVLFGLNAQLLGTGSSAEATQWAWFEQEVAALGEDESTVVFLHRPLLRAPGDEGMPTGRYVKAEAAQRLLSGRLRSTLRLVVSGHTHQGLEFVADGVRHVWVPSSGFVINDAMQVPVGDKLVGIGLLTLGDGQAHYERRSPSGMVAHELSRLAFFAEAKM